LRLGWTRFWVSASATILMGCASGAYAQATAPRRSIALRKNEWKLAGLLPGRTTVQRAKAILGKTAAVDGTSLTWNGCDGLLVEVQADRQGMIQTVRLSQVATPDFNEDCSPALQKGRSPQTGLGLRIGDGAAKVATLYGNPDSRSPSTKDGQPLELLYYAFDWAGPDVPQVMQVVCTAEKDGQAGRVVQITLAASSL
jgi:hypothetical protein